MKHKLAFAVMTALLTIGLSPVISYADTITFTLSNPNQTAVAGGTATFTATVTADPGNGGPIFLNDDEINALFAVDDTGFDDNFLPPEFDPGDTVTDELFAFTLPPDATVGEVFSGTFTLLGGGDGNAIDPLGSQDFSVTVVAGSPVPEPSSLILLGTGLSGVFVTLRRKAFRSAH